MNEPALNEAPSTVNGPIAVEPLTYFPGAREPWPADVKLLVILALLAGAIGVLNVGAEAWMTYQPGLFARVGSGLRFGSTTSIGFESARLISSALLLSGAIAFLAQKRAARMLLKLGAMIALTGFACASGFYWYYEIALSKPPSPPGDWVVKALWQLERLIQVCAIPILLLLVLARPSVKSKFLVTGS